MKFVEPTIILDNLLKTN